MSKSAGWVDLQVNGFLGIDFSLPGLEVADVHRVTTELRERGISSYCPTVISSEEAVYRANLPVIARAMRERESRESILGIHLEGPFLNPRCSGAHPRHCLREPEIDSFQRWNDLTGGSVVLCTLAPELPGAHDFIEAVSAGGVTVSVGHSLAGAEDLRAAVRCGARSVTHLGNGIPLTVARHANPIINQLAETELSVMMIPDGTHLPVNVVKLIRGMRPVRGIVATSDCSPVAGLPPGTYQLWGKPVTLTTRGQVLQSDGESLAGSARHLGECMEWLGQQGLFTEAELLAIGRTNALELIGKS